MFAFNAFLQYLVIFRHKWIPMHIITIILWLTSAMSNSKRKGALLVILGFFNWNVINAYVCSHLIWNIGVILEFSWIVYAAFFKDIFCLAGFDLQYLSSLALPVMGMWLLLHISQTGIHLSCRKKLHTQYGVSVDYLLRLILSSVHPGLWAFLAHFELFPLSQKSLFPLSVLFFNFKN